MDILITEDLESPAIERLATRFSIVRDQGLWREPERLGEALGTARTVLIRNQARLTAELLASAPNLLAIGRLGVGLDNIDLDAASQHGVVVIAPLKANAVSVAELTLGLLLALARKIPQGDRSTKAGGWDRRGCAGMEVDGKTLGLCGFGRIGRQVAVRARAFGLRVFVFDPFVKADSAALRETGAVLVTRVEEALAQADFVSSHLPLTPQTRHFFNPRTLAAMKRGAFFINTSRGGVVDEAALLTFLRSGHLAGAALDVRETEPPGAPDPLAGLENVLFTPHIGSFTDEAQTRTFETVCADLDRVLSGEPALNFVNFARPVKSSQPAPVVQP